MFYCLPFKVVEKIANILKYAFTYTTTYAEPLFVKKTAAILRHTYLHTNYHI